MLMVSFDYLKYRLGWRSILTEITRCGEGTNVTKYKQVTGRSLQCFLFHMNVRFITK